MIVPAPKQMMISENTDWLTEPGTTYFCIKRTGDYAIYAIFWPGDSGMLGNPEETDDNYSVYWFLYDLLDSVYRSVKFRGL